MRPEELEILLKSDESYRIERTTSTGNMDKFQEAICAFANDLPGSRKKGYLLIGVTDDGKVSGLEVDDKLMIKISAIRSDGNILPLPAMHVEKVPMPGGDVLVVEVTPSFATPVRYRGRTFVRIGPRRDIASADEERILAERNQAALPTFDVMPCREATIDDIDIDYIRDNYIPKAIDAETLASDHRPIKEQMASLRLYNLAFDCPTYAAIILFGKNPKYFLLGDYVQFVEFEGYNTGAAVVNQRDFKGALCEMLPRLESFIRDALIKERPVPVSLFREKSVFNYPNEALRELMMNACMHRDYQSNMPIRIYQYKDRIEIMNPGGLYGKARPENFPNVNDYRNPVVAEGMKVLKYVNMFNHGVRNVQDLLSANDSVPARFDIGLVTAFKVEVEDANITDRQEVDELTTSLQQAYNKLTEKGRALLLVLDDKELSAKELRLTTSLQQAYGRDKEMSQQYFRAYFLNPVMKLGLVESTENPNHPRHPKQKYRLTDLGRKVLALMIKIGHAREAIAG